MRQNDYQPNPSQQNSPSNRTYRNEDISIIQTIAHDKSNVIVDLRKASVFRSVHIEHTINIPYDSFRTDILRYAPNRLTPVYLFCSSGDRSRYAAEYLIEMGYRNVTNLGAISSWKYGFVSESGKWIRCIN